jgi:hypothetical protein
MIARVIFFAILIISSLTSVSQTALSDSTRIVVAELSTFETIMQEVMYHGEGGVGPTYKPKVYSTFERLVQVATEDELIELCNSKNALVACYALKALLEKGSTQILTVIGSLEDSRIRVEEVNDDIIETPEIFIWMIDEALYYQSYKDFGFSPIEISTLKKFREDRVKIIKAESDEEIKQWEKNNR